MRKSLPYALALIVLLAVPLSAQTSGDILRGTASDPFEERLAEDPGSPQARLEAWKRAILDFAGDRLTLTEEQLLVLLDAVETVQVAAFDDESGTEVEALRASLDRMEKTLSTDGFISLLGRFEGLQRWLYQNNLIHGLVTKSFAACTCKANNACQNSTCQAVSCTSENGSKNWGRCGVTPEVRLY